MTLLNHPRAQHAWRWGLFSFAALALGCATDSGGLGQATFAPDCLDTDLTCTALGLDAPLAVGARLTLNLDTETPGSSTPPLSLEAVDATIIDVDGRDLVAVGPGVAAVLVTTDSLVVDFMHIWVEEPGQLMLVRHADDGREQGPISDSLQMLAGEELVLSGQLMTDTQPLLGSGDIVWSASDEMLVTNVNDGFSHLTRFVARAPGTATITADQLGMSAIVNVEALP